MVEINEAFGNAIKNFGYEGVYSCIFPVKVNQHFEWSKRRCRPAGNMAAAWKRAARQNCLP